jgi:hypothetical protein
MFNERFEHELALIDEALTSEKGEIALIDYLNPFVQTVRTLSQSR